MWNRSFLILHGVENRRPAEHWQYDLAQQLREHREQVFYPQLPDPDRPALAAWTEAIEAELDMMRGERIVVCHSLACVAWLHLAANRGDIPAADRVLLVSPPGPAAFSWDVIAGFTPASLDLTGLKLAVATPRLACSDNDPYCPEGAAEVFGLPLGCDVDLLVGAGHVTVSDGYGPWPSVLDWCLDPTTRLAVN
ncbi:alpha/beta hydrolase [Streptomyces sp. AP-93]|uniref:RBBP9/YdeN family alpha/beta hydrolase n=1 Tax=Streptomyces sp. AP-93 TaxID=2929048 RepID=UPI001FB01999|nr:alpha/beta hydrolase [Streptomyces sp. AP-93]MCJ0871195.1 alpha/beta hydrolase [Streptomyces sp. AP-93]